MKYSTALAKTLKTQAKKKSVTATTKYALTRTAIYVNIVWTEDGKVKPKLVALQRIQ